MARKDSFIAFLITLCVVAAIILAVGLITVFQHRDAQEEREKALRTKRIAGERFGRERRDLARRFQGAAQPSNIRGESVTPVPVRSTTESRKEQSAIKPLPTEVSPWVKTNLSGRIVDPWGRSQPGVFVTLDIEDGSLPDMTRAESNLDGSFQLTIQANPDWLSLFLASAKPRFAVHGTAAALLLHQNLTRGNLEEEHLIVIAKTRPLAGRIIDSVSSRGVSGARIKLSYPIAVAKTWPVWRDGLELGFDTSDSQNSDVSGHFALPKVPQVPGCLLQIDHEQYESITVPLTKETETAEFVLQPLDQDQGTGHWIKVQGVVLDQDENPIDGAVVKVGPFRTRSDGSGVFEVQVDWRRLPSDSCLFAEKHGYQTARSNSSLSESISNHLHRHAPLEAITLVCGQPSVRMEGQVIGSDGAPAAGIHLKAMRVSEGSLAGDDTVTDKDGFFSLDGLQPGFYRLEASDVVGGGLLSTRPLDAPARNLKLSIDGPLFRQFHGRVHTGDGNPVANAKVRVYFPDGHPDMRLWSEVTSEQDGSFMLLKLPADKVRIQVTHPEMEELSQRFKPKELGAELTITVQRLCYFQLEVENSAHLPAHIEALDQDGNILSLYPLGDNLNVLRYRFQSSTEVIGVGESVQALRITRDDRVIETIPIRPAPGQIITFRRKTL